MMIEFYNDESVTMPRLHKSIVRAWIKQVAELHGKTVGNLCYQFCDDERILEVNRQFLQQDVVLRHNPLFHRTFAAQPNHMLPRRL